MHQETFPPKISSRNIFHMPETFRRTAGVHCSCQVQSFSDQFQSLVSFSSEHHVDLASNCSGALLPVPPSYPLCRTVAWTVASVGGELAEVHRPRERRRQHLLRLPERRSEGRRRPAPPTPPEAYAWPSSSPCVLQHSRRGLRGVEHALCRRWAREAVPSKTWSIAQVWPSLATG